jgi:urease accessory protein
MPILVDHKKGNLATTSPAGLAIDWLYLEWFETNKRILHKRTAAGKQVVLKFLQQNPELAEGDILFADESCMIAVSIIPVKAMVITPANIMEASMVCYEIGNKHLPLFYEDNDLLVPYDSSLFNLLNKIGYSISVDDRKLVHPIKTSVLPHAHEGGGTGLFTKILKLTGA